MYCDGKTISNPMGFSMMLLSAVAECLVDANSIFKLALRGKVMAKFLFYR